MLIDGIILNHNQMAVNTEIQNQLMYRDEETLGRVAVKGTLASSLSTQGLGAMEEKRVDR